MSSCWTDRNHHTSIGSSEARFRVRIGVVRRGLRVADRILGRRPGARRVVQAGVPVAPAGARLVDVARQRGVYRVGDLRAAARRGVGPRPQLHSDVPLAGNAVVPVCVGVEDALERLEPHVVVRKYLQQELARAGNDYGVGRNARNARRRGEVLHRRHAVELGREQYAAAGRDRSARHDLRQVVAPADEVLVVLERPERAHRVGRLPVDVRLVGRVLARGHVRGVVRGDREDVARLGAEVREARVLVEVGRIDVTGIVRIAGDY